MHVPAGRGLEEDVAVVGAKEELVGEDMAVLLGDADVPIELNTAQLRIPPRPRKFFFFFGELFLFVGLVEDGGEGLGFGEVGGELVCIESDAWLVVLWVVVHADVAEHGEVVGVEVDVELVFPLEEGDALAGELEGLILLACLD